MRIGQLMFKLSSTICYSLFLSSVSSSVKWRQYYCLLGTQEDSVIRCRKVLSPVPGTQAFNKCKLLVYELVHFTAGVWVASVWFVQSDLLGVGFAGAVVRLAPQRGAGPRGGCRGGSDTEAVGERAPSGGQGEEGI